MKKNILLISIPLVFICSLYVKGQNVPEMMYYKFDVPGATTLNSASAPVGTNPSAVTGLTIGGTGQFGSGLVGTGLASSSNNVNTGWTTSLTGSWTISMWVNIPVIPPTTRYFFGDINAGSFRCFTGGVATTTGIRLTGPLTFDMLSLPVGVAPFVVHYVYNSTTGVLSGYINGVFNSSQSIPGLSITGAGPFFVGGYSGTNGSIEGTMDEFRMYNRALDASEISASWNITLPGGPCTNPPTAGTSTASPTTVCAAVASTLNLVGNTFGTGQTYTWQSSTLIGGPYSNISGPLTSAGFVINPVSTAYYRCVVTCAQSDTSSPVLVTVNPVLAAGTYTINNTLPTGGGNYNSFTAAINALACGISGPVVFNVSAGQAFIEDPPVISVNSTSVNTLKFRKSGAGSNPVIRPSGGAGANDAGIAISGSDYVTFDGIDININAGATLEYGYYITNASVTNGATNDSIKNCTITMNRTNTLTKGIYQNIPFTPSAVSGANSNNTYMNLTIKNVYTGIQLTGLSSTTLCDVNNKIITSACNIYNIIGDPSVPMDIGGGTSATQTAGIRLTNQAGFTISNNKVYNVAATTTVDGIFVETFLGLTGSLISTLSNNIVKGIRINSTTATTQVNGIRITNSTSTPTTGTVLRVYNNSISDITSAYVTATGVAWTATTGIKGLNMASTTAVTAFTYEIYNNSVSIDGSGSPFLHSTAFQRSVTTAGNTQNLIRNNLFANYTGAQTTPAAHYAFVNGLVGSATALGVTGVSFVNNNDLWIANATQGFAARGATTDYATVPTWQTANGQATANQAIDPQVTAVASDLHVNNIALDALGTTYPAYLTQDLDCSNRTGTADMGAYIIAACTSPPTAGTATATPSLFFCAGGALTLDLTGKSTGIGQTYQWQSSLTGGGAGFSNLGALQNTSLLNTTASTTLFYRCLVTCSGNTQTSTEVQVTVNGALLSGTYTINPTLPPSGTNFQTFSAAVAALNCGISAAVVFNVNASSGNYNEQIDIPAIPGSTAIKTVTFNGNGATLSFDASFSTYYATLNLSGADNLIFNNLNVASIGASLAWGIHLMNSSDNNVFNNCSSTVNMTATATTVQALVINASNTVYSTGGTGGSNNAFNNCTFTGGYHNVASYGASGALITGNSYIGCSYREAYSYSSYHQYTTNGIIRNCIMERPARTNTTTAAGAYFTTGCAGNLIEKNRIRNMFGGTSTTTGTFYGIACPVAATIGNENKIYNNIVYGINFNGTLYGLYLSGANYCKAYHNSISLDHTGASGTTTTYGIYQTGTTGCDVRNNIVAIKRVGAGVKSCVYYTSTNVNSNKNDLFINAVGGTNFTGNFNGTGYPTLVDWQAGNSSVLDQQSFSVNPGFANPSIGLLIPTSGVLNNVGDNVGVTTDINGNPRTVTPDIGAFEFTPPLLDGIISWIAPVSPVTVGLNTVSIGIFNNATTAITSVNATYTDGVTPVNQNFTGLNIPTGVTQQLNFTVQQNITTPLTMQAFINQVNGVSDGDQNSDTVFQDICLPLSAGTYTINSAVVTGGTNFQTFTEAIARMVSCGISGPVVFDVNATSGPYNEQVDIPAIPGASAVNTITINGNGRTISFNATSSLYWATLNFSGADYFTINNLIIASTGAANAWAIHMMNNSNYNTFNSCSTLVNITSTSTNSMGVVMNASNTTYSSGGSGGNYNTFNNCVFTGGYHSVVCYGALGFGNVGNNIIGCTLRDNYSYATYHIYSNSGIIRNCIMERPTRTNTTTSAGVYLTTGCLNMLVENNRIRNMYVASSTTTGTFYGIYGAIAASVGNENKYYNNAVYSNNFMGTIYGIYLSSATNFKAYHNTIVFDDTTSALTTASYGIYTTSATNSDIRNNIIFHKRAGSGTKTALYNSSNPAISNYNNIYVDTTMGGINYLQYNGTTGYTTLAAWQAASGLDLLSKDLNPLFVSPSTGDFTPTVTALNGYGANVGIAYDINNSSRVIVAPDPGAFEFSVAGLDAALAWVSPVIGPAGPNPITVSIGNLKATVITSVDVTYTDGVNPPVSQSFTGLSIPGAGNQPLTFTTPYNLTANTTLKAYISSVNGVTDETQANDTVVQTVCIPLNGTYTINSILPPSGTNFQNFTSVVNALACGGVTGPVTLNVAPGSGPYNEQITIPPIFGSSAVNTITVNGSGQTLTYDASAALSYGTLNLAGADYFIFNDLNVAATGAANAWGIHFINYSDFNVFNNCTSSVSITSTSTATQSVIMNGSNTVYSTGGSGGNNNTFNNCLFSGGYYGVVLYGASGVGNGNANNAFIGCKFHDSYAYSTYNLYTTDGIIRNCLIEKPNRTSTTTSAGAYFTTGCAGMLVEKNIVRNMFASNPTYTGTCYGFACIVSATNGNENVFVNNLIYNINFNGILYGLYFSGGNYIKAYHNTISLDHVASTATGSTYGIYSTGTSGLDFRNNMISITRGGTGTKYCLDYTGTVALSNNNNLYITPSASNFVGFNGTTTYTTLAAWQAAFSLDMQSVSLDPVYYDVSQIDFTPTNPGVWNIGANVGVATDFNGAPRTLATPDPGAFEADYQPYDLGVKALVGIVTTGCLTASEAVTVTIKNYGLNAVNFSTMPASVTCNVTGATTATLTGNLSGVLNAGATMNFTFPTTLNMTAVGTYTFKSYTTMATDTKASNDSMTVATRTKSAATAGIVSSSLPSICITGSPVLTVSGSNAGNIQWQENSIGISGPWNNVGTGATTYSPGTITQTMYYRAITSCLSDIANSNSLTVAVGPPDPAPVVTGDSHCAGIMNHLTASGVSALHWYTAQTGGVLKHIGATWDSVWTTTTTYWVESNNGVCPSPRVAVVSQVNPIPPLVPTATSSTICFGDSSQLDAGSFIGGSLTTPLIVGNSSSASGFDLTNISGAPITIHYLSFTSTAAASTIINESVYYNPTPMNCVFPSDVTTAPGWILLGTVACTSAGTAPNLTLIPLNLNITVPAGATYAFAFGGASVAYTSGTSGCPIMASDANIQVKEGFGGTLTGTIANRRWNGSVTYDYGDPNLIFSWTPSASLNNPVIKTPKASPASTTTYTVAATSAFGCSSSSTVVVNVNPVPPQPVVDSVTNVFCGCGSVILYAHANGVGTSIRWYGTPSGGTLLGTGSPFTTAVFCGPKTFYAEEFDPGTGCSSSSRIAYPVTPTTAIAINAGTDAVLCNGAGPAPLSVTSANPGYAYAWTPSLGLNTTTGSSVSSNPGVNTTYIVTGTDGGSGCVTKDTVTVFVGVTPIIGTITYTPSSLCFGDTAYLSTTANIPGGNVFDFTPPYTPATWTTQHTVGDLGVVNSFTTTSLSMTSSDGGTGTTDIDVIHTVTATGSITFNWSYSTVDDAEFDYPMYYKNGVRTMLPGYNITLLTTPQSGSASIPVTVGDVFGFTMESFDNGFGGATTTFTNVVFPGATAVLTYAWTPPVGLTNANTASPKAVAPVGTTTYTVTVANNGCTATTSIPVTVSSTPVPPVVTGDTVCGPDTVHVSAIPSSGTNTLFWTDTIGGQIIQTGDNYSHYATTSGSYYVTEAAGSGNSYVGYSGVDLASGYFPDIASYMNFTVINAEGVFINTVQVATNLGAGTWPLVVALVNTSGQIVSVHDTIYITGGNTLLQTISLNMFVPQGSWRLQPIFNPNLSVHQLAAVTASLPWSIPGLINITCFGNASSTCFSTSPTGTFGLFYNWNVSTVCNSMQSVVNYVVNPSSPIGVAATGGTSYCDVASTTLSAVDSVGSIYESYEWSPATGLSSTTGSSVTLSGLTQTTTYTLTAHDVDAGCNAITTKTITIQPKPSLLLSYHDTTICRTETSLQLGATAAKSSIVQVGERQDPNFVNGYLYGGNTTQFSQLILTPAELNAAGLFGPTAITSIAYYVSSKLTTTTYTVDISMRSDGLIPAAFPTTAHILTGLTNVYNNPSIASTLGWNTYNFTTPFNWDGVSNVLVSQCFTHNIPGFFDIVYTSAAGASRYNAVNASVCGAAAGALLTDRPNVRFTGGTVFYNWTPAAGLSSTSVEDPIMSPNFAGVDTALYYVLTVTDPLSGCTAKDSVHINVSSTPLVPLVVFVGDSVLCYSGSPVMRAYGTSGSFQWQSSSNGINFNNIPGENNDTLNAATITTSTYYRFYSTCGDTSYSRILSVIVNNPQVVATTGDTICGFGQVCLSAAKNQPNYDVSWYNVPSGGTALATGDTFCTNIGATTTFYASVSSPGGPPLTSSYYNYTTTSGSNTFPFGQTAGKEVQWFAGPGEFVTPSAAPAGGMITSISFYASTATAGGTYNQFTVKLGQLSAPFAGGAFYSGPMTTVILPSTKTIVTSVGAWFTLTFDVPFAYDPTKWLVVDVGHCGITAGSGFNVYQNTLSGVRRVWSVGGCPFAFTSNDATLPGITLGLTTGSQCNSPRVAVTAVSTTAPPLATVSHISTICEGSCATLAVDAAGQSNYQTFSWTPGTGLNSTTGASVQACPTTTTTYTVLGTDIIGGCQRFDTVRVVVNPAPVVTVSSTPPQICLGDSAQLLANATGGPTGTLAMPPELSTFAGNVRGYSFTAPVSFTITGVQALGTTAGTQSVAIVKFVPAVPPPIFSATTNAFTTLFLAQNVPTGVIPVSITVNAGDVIGILGCRSNVTSYANPAGPYATTIGGMPVTLTRMGMQFPLTTTAPQDLWTETAGSIGRVELIYGTTSSTTYAWSPSTGLSATNISNPKASPAAATTYTVTVTNTTTGCTKTASLAINITPQPIPYIFPNDSVLCTGQVINIVARDSGAYIGGWPVGTSFDFGFGPTTDSTFLVNGPGNYNVHVTLPPSLGSCNKTSYFANIDYRDAPVLIVSTDSVKCNGTATGTISSQLFLGNPPYRFKYYNNLGNLVRDTVRNESYDTLYNVAAGNYCVIAHDTANTVYPPPSCASDSVCILIGEPPLLVASEVHTTIACNGNSSSVTISATGGTPPLTGTGTFTQFAGTQIYTVTDALGCTDTIAVVITQPPVLTVTTTVSNIPCTYVAANINTIVGGGTPSYEFQWSNSAVTLNQNSLGSGTYTITVTDLHGCTATSTATVAPPGPLVVTTTPVMPVCRGAATGSITTSHTGGVGGYTYLWSGGNTNQNRSGLAAGTYTVTVTDINGCTKTKTTVITQPATTLVINSSQTNVRCFGLATGVATASPAGGSTPYSYSWNTLPVKTTASITGLTFGVYTCSVTDAVGCTKTLVVTITQPTDITVFQTQSNVTFPGGNNGSASVSVSGGTPGYTYSWNTVPVVTTATVTGLFAGTYKCTITDTKSCIKKVTFIITEPIAKPGDTPDESLDIRAYPNPTSGVVMLSFNTQTEDRFSIRVSDVTGRILFDEEKTAGKGLNEFMYDFTSFSKGVYFINVSAGDRKKVIRIVIE